MERPTTNDIKHQWGVLIQQQLSCALYAGEVEVPPAAAELADQVWRGHRVAGAMDEGDVVRCFEKMAVAPITNGDPEVSLIAECSLGKRGMKTILKRAKYFRSHNGIGINLGPPVKTGKHAVQTLSMRQLGRPLCQNRQRGGRV